MRISELCFEVGLIVQRGGQDDWGHVYEADECRFGFEFRQHVFCFRYRSCEGTEGWFLNNRLPEERESSLVFSRISEADVIQILALYLWCQQQPFRKKRPEPHGAEQRIFEFGS